MGFKDLARRCSAIIAVASMLLLISAEIVNANAIPIFPTFGSEIAFLAAVPGIFLFNYLVNLGSAALTLKAFGFMMDTSSINKLAVTMFKVTIAGTLLVFLIHGLLDFRPWGRLYQYSVSAILVGAAEIILLSFLLYLYGLNTKKAVSVSVCAITFGALIGLPFVLMLI